LVVIKKVRQKGSARQKFQKLNEVSAWVEQYRMFWEKRLDKMDALVHELKANEKKKIRARSTAKLKRAPYEK
jgi:uncharacterized coiled-coil protein SlyX